ncbi:hypothetical protein PF005_g8306 [Phytophthora fragariae]|uniref:Uncharacterized protein n=1 Tax=Phytophthora fragariae TaxID=53985 RepID=A0A6A3FAZ1_9STRA|nr:hypothetical protein PF003_g37345 [Phytophthora fragariae]KAE8941020.1 hypothetical protein PF009_g9169 [Phytophthora fragariae]KAE9016150.1 hypothetical protein PF011_g7284 [Phytophthora fragariae]KAE9114769.1 hypothetical protein PF007_g10250 [Phytophthora fragariae]KAE9120110.1 hypothetical protein PF010_g7611 [Phytophthora fragariae]
MGERRQEGERLHSTVRLNQFTLQFEDAALEKAYEAGLHLRKKALWLRSLLPAAASQILFALADGLDYPVENLLVTVPTRVLIAMLQVAMFLLVRWDLVRAREQTMLLVSVASGIPTLLLYALQRPSLCQWDALFVTFGLSFYTIPKVTPLGYVSSFYGSWATAAVYAALTFVVRPPTRKAEGVLGIFFLVPMVWVFNTIAYYSEYNSRERFALRRRLRRESITLAVACTSAGGEALLQGGEDDGWLLLQTLSLRGLMAANTNSTASFVVAVILWGAFTLGGWTSLPDTLKFVDEATGWAWFSHCAGVTVFLLVMTRRLRWLLVVPVVGAFVLWVMSLAMPASWIIFSAHSVGYGLLLACVVIAMGVFGWFVCAWRELVSFLTRSCFLYPQLQAGMEREYPLLVRIVSEYTAGFDPEIFSARVPTATAIESMGTQVAVAPAQKERNLKSGSTLASTTIEKKQKGENLNAPHKTKKKLEVSLSSKSDHVAVKPMATPDAPPKEDNNLVSTDDLSDQKMVSVLPSFKPGKCFFCSKNDAEHFVPACGMWGKWAHWRMNQQHNMNNAAASSSAALSKGAVAVSMCTSYYDLQNDKSQLVARVQDEEKKNANLNKRLVACEEREQKLSLETVRLKAELHAMEEKHAAELRRCEVHLQEKIEAVQKEANRGAHDRKLEIKQAEVVQSTALQRRLEASERMAEESSVRAQNAEDEAATLRASLQQSQHEVGEWKSKAEELKSQLSSLEFRYQQQIQAQGRSSPRFGPSALDFSFSSTASGGSSVDVSPVASLQTLQPAGRLPYAQSLEIEGLRESSRRSQDAVDYSKRWRLLQASDRSKREATP